MDRATTTRPSRRGLLRTWPQDGPKVLWTVPMAAGFGGPAVSGGNVYLLDRDEKVGDTLRVLDLANGKELWTFAYDAPGSFMFAGSRMTPTVDGEHVYTVGPMGDLHAISVKTRKPVWRTNIWKDFGGGTELPRWAIVQHPVIYGDLLIVAPQTPEVGVVAYDKLTGAVRWKSAALSGIPGYVTPVDRQGRGRRSPRHDHRRRGSRPEREGRQRQRSRSAQRQGAVDLHQLAVHHPGPAGGRRRRGTRAHHGRLWCRLGDDQGGEEGRRHLRRVRAVQESRLRRAHAAAGAAPGHFYSHYTINERSDGLVAMGMDGQIKWKTDQQPPFVRGGSVLADGLLLMTDGSTKLYLVEPIPPASSRSPAPSSSSRATTGRHWRWWTARCWSVDRRN